MARPIQRSGYAYTGCIKQFLEDCIDDTGLKLSPVTFIMDMYSFNRKVDMLYRVTYRPDHGKVISLSLDVRRQMYPFFNNNNIVHMYPATKSFRLNHFSEIIYDFESKEWGA